ncbi:uncharacterized protein LOC114938469 [Nylanderia fulva]|uniref:uncharacterized protein LOC114938469 n=1 Tax=Nylanderia fulva TaxID=613905 RepID=UPI0010FB5A0C|nr:uncharacterized protein LOC114938469 [Nylanderia fulva]
MLEQIQDNWRILKDKLEINIIEKYSFIARFLAVILLGFCCFGLIMYTLMQFLPLILDTVIPLNESRLRRPILITEYFIDQEKYMNAILLHYILAVAIGIVALCGPTMTILTYILHSCALLDIASYRMENAINRSILAIPSPTREYLLYRRIVHAVSIHRRAIASVFLFFYYYKTLALYLFIIH